MKLDQIDFVTKIRKLNYRKMIPDNFSKVYRISKSNVIFTIVVWNFANSRCISMN